MIDRSGAMPRPPPEFDFASDSDFLTGAPVYLRLSVVALLDPAVASAWQTAGAVFKIMWGDPRGV